MTVTQRNARPATMGELLERLGNISPERVRLKPFPATEKDVVKILNRTDRVYELVDGVLVEKVMGYLEATIANWLSHLLQLFLDENDLGNLAGPDATMRLMPELVRIPDISFVRWEHMPNQELPKDPVPDLVPDLAVEVISEGNTAGEMKRKLRDYFFCGVPLVWFVDWRPRTVQVFTSPEQSVTLTEKDTLDGGEVLPGFSVRVKDIFSRLDRKRTKKTSSQKKNSPRRKRQKGENAGG